MKYDLDLIQELCSELSLRVAARSSNEVAVELDEGTVLIFVNAELEQDSLIGFQGGEWHYHDDLTCWDGRSSTIELNYLDILTGLADGSVLICEHWVDGQLRDRLLVHRDYVNEFRHLRAGAEIRIRRAPSPKTSPEDSVPGRPQPKRLDETNDT